MRYRSLFGTVALAACFVAAVVDAQAFDQTKYPDWTGAWRRIPVPGVTGQPGYDQTKRLGPAQQGANPRQHRSDTAGKMRHVHREAGVAVEHAGIDQPDRRHDQ